MPAPVGDGEALRLFALGKKTYAALALTLVPVIVAAGYTQQVAVYVCLAVTVAGLGLAAWARSRALLLSPPNALK